MAKTFKMLCLSFLALTVAGCGNDDDHGHAPPVFRDKSNADKGTHAPLTNKVYTAYDYTNFYPASLFYGKKYKNTKADSYYSTYSRYIQRKSCISNMKRLQKAAKLYMLNHGSMPSIYDLCGPGKYLRTEPTCPKDNRSYRIFRENGEIKVSCPNPYEDHKL